MHPVNLQCYFFWLIVSGFFLIIAPSIISSEQYKIDSIKLGKQLPDDFEPVSFYGYEINSIINFHKPRVSRYSVSCADLHGLGSFNNTCLLNSNLSVSSDIYVVGTGNLEILPHVSIVCPVEGCTLCFNLSGSVKLGQHAAIVAGSVVFSVASMTLEPYSSINTTSLGGRPPSQTSGTPVSFDGAGGGHGGRGASCLKTNQTNYWGGDVYAWSTLRVPWSHGSKGGGTSNENKFGGNGGGRIWLDVKDILYINGSLTAEGGDVGSKGGGGSGGSIVVRAQKLKGYGIISAAGGKGWGGGGGGRISMNCYSKQEDVKVTAHGGLSIGCPWNSGAAGTYFDASVLSLRVDNDNITTETETPLLDFSTSPLWTNVYVENNAKVLVPLLWTRVQVRGQISVLCGSSIIFGLSEDPVSEFEVVAEELLMSSSIIKVYGALRMAVKMLLMLKSQIQVDGGRNPVVTTSVFEVRNLVVLKESSVIISNANLALYGQGLLQLSGYGDAIKSQRLSLSLFYNIDVGPGSLLQAPLDDDSRSMVTGSLCESSTCPMDLIIPPDDCHVNNTLSFSVQICRVEDILVDGIIRGSIIHIHRARTVTIDNDGSITASKFGCTRGIGSGHYSHGASGGAGHGGRGGYGFFNGMLSEGGHRYGSAHLPCELGSGTDGPDNSYGPVAGGGLIVMGSNQWPLLSLDIYGSMSANGQSYGKPARNRNGTIFGGLGGGSGGTILLFLEALALMKNSSISVVGGYGGPIGGGGGGGGRIHFHWSKIEVGNDYVPLAFVNGTIDNGGGAGDGSGLHGEEGTVTGRECPKGLYGTFCTECPIGTYKDVEGSDPYLCTPCPQEHLPGRAYFISIRGGVTNSSCPYICISDKYRMPNCYSPLEDFIYTFGGPWPFSLLLSCIVVLLALLLRTLRIRFVGPECSFNSTNSIEHQSHHHFPYLLSLSEVRGTGAEESQSHVHRMYFMGPNTFREPWHLPYSPPDAIIEIVYEDAFNRFIDEINSVATYEWWEGSVHSILSVLAYPCAWLWKQWRRRKKIQWLQDYVKSEYDHSCLRSCRSRALYKGMKVGATPDLMVAYIDFFLGGDEKRLEMVASIQKRFPMCIIFGGDGSYMSPYNLHSDTLLTNLIGQYVPTTVWNRLVAGLNAQLRNVRHGFIRSSLAPVLNWIRSHGSPQLNFHGVKVEVGWFQATASGYYQLGILVVVGDHSLDELNHSQILESSDDNSRKVATIVRRNLKQPQNSQSSSYQAVSRKTITGGTNGGLINEATLKSLDVRRDYFFPFSLLWYNTRPVGRQDTVQLLISIMLLADLFITLLMLLLFYWISLGAFLAVLLVLPLSLVSPFPAGLNALFSKGPRRAPLSRIYALWNASSLSNIVVSFISGIIHYGISSLTAYQDNNTWISNREDDKWWLLPTILLLLKLVQARFVDWHIANLEVQDFSLLSPDPDMFWAYEST